METLFPTQERFEYQVNSEKEEIIPPITSEELFQVCRKMGNKKVLGMGNIPNIAIKTAIKTAPKMFTNMYNACLGEEIFPEHWKWQKLVLLPKSNKQLDDPSFYRSL